MKIFRQMEGCKQNKVVIPSNSGSEVAWLADDKEHGLSPNRLQGDMRILYADANPIDLFWLAPKETNGLR